MNTTMVKFVKILKKFHKEAKSQLYSERFCGMKKISDKVSILFVLGREADDTDKIKDVVNETNNLIRIINKQKKDIVKAQEIFDDFNILSLYIERAKFNNRESYQVIEFFINLNIESEIQENAVAVKMEKLQKLKFETIDTQELMKMIREGKIQELYSKDDEELSEEEVDLLNEIEDRITEFTQDMRDLCKNNCKFKECIMDKMPNITLEDIVDGLNALKNLDCTDEVIDKIKMFLLSTYEKNLHQSSERIEDLELNDTYIDMLVPVNKDKDGDIIKDEKYSQNIRLKRMIRSHNEALDVTPNTAQETVEAKKYLTEKEVRELKKYLGIFYDTYHSKIRRIPNPDELFKTVDCMEKLEEDDMSIRRYLTNLLDFVKEQETKKENEQENKQDNQQEDYVRSKEELVRIASLFIRYKVENKYIYAFIGKYRGKFIKVYDNPIDEYLDRLEEIRFYDESIKSNMDELYAMALNEDEDNYEVVVSMMREYLDKIDQKSDNVSYEYNLAYKLNQV